MGINEYCILPFLLCSNEMLNNFQKPSFIAWAGIKGSCIHYSQPMLSQHYLSGDGTVLQLWHRCTSQLYINSSILGEGYTTKSIKRHTKAHLTLSLNWSSTGAGPGLLGAVVAVMDVGVRHQIHRGLGVLVHQPRARPPPAHAATAHHQMCSWLILFPNWTYSLQLYHCWVQTRNCCTRKCGKGFKVVL